MSRLAFSQELLVKTTDLCKAPLFNQQGEYWSRPLFAVSMQDIGSMVAVIDQVFLANIII